jgi:hypothetical protein
LGLEAFEAELERMNGAVSAENQGLQHDNKQLNTLIKEYEQTLETLMSAFRTRAVSLHTWFTFVANVCVIQRDVQDHELSLIRDYEAKLLVQEEEDATQELVTSTAVSRSLARLSHSLRQLMRSLGGEDRDGEPSGEGEEPDAEWALNRECELARLEKENENLRRMLGLPVVPGCEMVGRSGGGEQRRTSISVITGMPRQGKVLGRWPVRAVPGQRGEHS